MVIGRELREIMANKENECFLSVSDEAMEKLSRKYIPENTKKISAWRDTRSKKFAVDRCPLDIFEKFEAGALNR